jgi:hypothetical protein
MIEATKEFLIWHLSSNGELSCKEALENHFEEIRKRREQYITKHCAPGTDISYSFEEAAYDLDDAVLELFSEGLIGVSDEDQESFRDWLWSVEWRNSQINERNPESYYYPSAEDEVEYKARLKRLRNDEISKLLIEGVTLGNSEMTSGYGVWKEWPFAKIRWKFHQNKATK